MRSGGGQECFIKALKNFHRISVSSNLLVPGRSLIFIFIVTIFSQCAFLLGDKKLLAKILVKLMQDGTFDQNPQIALVFHGPAGEYQIRTILPEQDADQRVQNFYTNFTKNLRQSSDEQFQNEQFQLAVKTAGQFLAAHLDNSPSPAIGSSTPLSEKKRVSPEVQMDWEQTHADETPSDSVTARQEEAGVRAIASDFGNDQGITMDEVPSDDHDILPQGLDDDRKPAAAAAKVARCSLSPSPSECDEQSQKSHHDAKAQGEENAPTASLDIDRYAPWKEVFKLLLRSGWKWRSHELYTKVLVRPGCTVKKGKLDSDYFPTDTCGHGQKVKEYIKEHYGWIGDDVMSESSDSSGDSSPGSAAESREPSGDAVDDESEFENVEDEDHAMVDDNIDDTVEQQSAVEQMDSPPSTKKAKKSAKRKKVPAIIETKDEFEFTGEDYDRFQELDIEGYGSWDSMWEKMQSDGWSATDGGADPYRLYYLKPGMNEIKGIYGKDFFYEADAKDFAEAQFGWKGLRPPVQRKISISISTEKPKKKKSKKMAIKPKKVKKPKAEASKKKAEEQKSPPESPIHFDDLKKIEGWKAISAGKYNKLHDWYYVRPGFSPKSKDTVLGTHYFQEEQQAVAYATDHKDCLKFLSKAPSVSGSPATYSSIQSPCGQESVESSLVESPATSVAASIGESSVEYCDFIVKDCEDCWWLTEPIPKFRKVWSLLHKKLKVKYNRLPEYIIPGGTKCTTAEDIQIHFCKNGLPPGSSDILTEEEMKLVTRFASLAHLPKKVDGHILTGKNGIEILKNLPGGSSFDDSKAWEFLCNKFDAKMRDGDYFVGCIEGDNAEKNFASIEEVRKAIRCYGLNSECAKNEYHAALILWSSVLPLPTNDHAKSVINENCHEEVEASGEVKAEWRNQSESTEKHSPTTDESLAINQADFSESSSGRKDPSGDEEEAPTDEMTTQKATLEAEMPQGESPANIENLNAPNLEAQSRNLEQKSSDSATESTSQMPEKEDFSEHSTTPHDGNGTIAEITAFTQEPQALSNQNSGEADEDIDIDFDKQSTSQKPEKEDFSEHSTTPHDGKGTIAEITPFTQETQALSNPNSGEADEDEDTEIDFDADESQHTESKDEATRMEYQGYLTQDQGQDQIEGTEDDTHNYENISSSSPTAQSNYHGTSATGGENSPDPSNFLNDVLSPGSLNQCLHPPHQNESVDLPSGKNLLAGFGEDLN